MVKFIVFMLFGVFVGVAGYLLFQLLGTAVMQGRVASFLGENSGVILLLIVLYIVLYVIVGFSSGNIINSEFTRWDQIVAGVATFLGLGSVIYISLK